MPNSNYKKRIRKRDLPEHFSTLTESTITRIEEHHNVLGVLYLYKDVMSMCTMPENMGQTLAGRLPILTQTVHRALVEIVSRYLLRDYKMKICKNMCCLVKGIHDEWLVEQTAAINSRNPVVERITDDDSVEGVIMTNEEGSPILTNYNSMSATNFGLGMQRLGLMANHCVKEMDTFDEVLIMRLITKKNEIIVAPHSEFNIIVVLHDRYKEKRGKNVKAGRGRGLSRVV